MLQLQAERELGSNVLFPISVWNFFPCVSGIGGSHNLFDEKTGLQTDCSFCNFLESPSYTVKITDEIKSMIVFLLEIQKWVQPFIQLTCNFPDGCIWKKKERYQIF